MAIRYIYPPTGEPVTKEPWRWVAFYNDGTTLAQFEVKAGQATFHKFAEIDQSKLANFMMTHDTHPTLTLRFDPDTMELIHFYRNQILNVPIAEGQLNETRHERLYYFGYKDKAGQSHLTGVLPNGSVIISNDHDHIVDLTGPEVR